MFDAWRKLMELLDRRERRRLQILLVLIAAMGLANMAGIAAIIPFLNALADSEAIRAEGPLAGIYESLGLNDHQDIQLALGITAIVAYLGAIAIRALASYAMFRFGALRSHSIAVRILHGYLGQPYTWFLDRHSAKLVKTLVAEVAQLVQMLMIPLLNMIANFVVVLAMIGLMVLVNPMASLLIVVVIGSGYAITFAILRRRLHRMGRQRFAANEQRYRVALETMAAIKEIKVLGLEKASLRRFERPSLDHAEAMASVHILGELPRHVLEGVAFVGILAVLLMLISQGSDLASLLPTAGVYALAGARLMPASQMLYKGLNQVRFSKPALDAVHADLKQADAALPHGRPAPMRLRKKLELREVSYTYPNADHPALRELSLEISAGSSVGLVGGTGAGKTTAVDVILGLLTPEGGALIIDGRELLGEEATRAWRSSLGYVPQQIYLVDESIAANIAFGQKAEDIDHAAVVRAAKMAQLHEFIIEKLPAGYHTLVGDRGTRLSGGQRQRIGIARALYHDPDVLIFDEATSALDNITERAVVENIMKLPKKKTIIVVAHRLSAVRSCDEIFFFEEGQVAARGNYQELIECSNAFRKMATEEL